MLRLFDRYIQSRDISAVSAIDSSVIDDFLRSHPRRVSVHRFFKFAVMQQWIERNPATPSPRPETATRIPYLFDLDAAKRLLAVARSFRSGPGHDIEAWFTRHLCIALRLGITGGRSSPAGSGQCRFYS